MRNGALYLLFNLAAAIAAAAVPAAVPNATAPFFKLPFVASDNNTLFFFGGGGGAYRTRSFAGPNDTSLVRTGSGSSSGSGSGSGSSRLRRLAMVSMSRSLCNSGSTLATANLRLRLGCVSATPTGRPLALPTPFPRCFNSTVGIRIFSTTYTQKQVTYTVDAPHILYLFY